MEQCAALTQLGLLPAHTGKPTRRPIGLNSFVHHGLNQWLVVKGRNLFIQKSWSIGLVQPKRLRCNHIIGSEGKLRRATQAPKPLAVKQQQQQLSVAIFRLISV